MARESRTTGKNRPFELLPTSMKGVYSFVPPPKGVDLRTASRRTLMKHGIFMRRPDPEREPKHFALWNKFVDEIWREENFNLPTFGPSPGIPHGLKGLWPTETYDTYQSGNWSGCVVVSSPSSPWVGAWGAWQVPTVSQPTTPADTSGQWQSASWVGLNGAGGSLIPGTFSTDVLQAGVSQNITGGNPSYSPWFEWVVQNAEAVAAQYCPTGQGEYCYVLPQTITSVVVNAGDTVSVVVQFVRQMGDNIGDPAPPGGPFGFGAVLFVNATTGQAYNIYLAPPPGASFAGDTAEWIMECQSGPAPVGPPVPYLGYNGTLPQFSPVTFQPASACNALDAPPEAAVGVLLQNGALVNFQDFRYINQMPPSTVVETNSSAGEGTVTITYVKTP